jgi:hypothetical protein
MHAMTKIKPNDLKFCLHVTSPSRINSILKIGLEPRVGVLSEQAGEMPGIFMFPSWEAMNDANWLFDEGVWPYEDEPALLCVDVYGIALDCDVDYEVICRTTIPKERIMVLTVNEDDWMSQKEFFLQIGGMESAPFIRDDEYWDERLLKTGENVKIRTLETFVG